MKFILLLVTSLLLLTGCDSNIVQTNTLNNNGVTQISPTVYVKGIRINAGGGIWHTIYIYCDNEGNPLGSGPITTNYTSNKHSYSNSVLN